MKKILTVITAAVCVLSFAAAISAARPEMTSYPKELVDRASGVTLNWSESPSGSAYPNSCVVGYGISPSDYYGFITQTAAGTAVFTPQDYGLDGGVYYMRVIDSVINTSSSREFKLYVENPNAPVYLAPANNAIINTLNPVFSWNQVSGVPYYTIMLFDSRAELDIGSQSITINANVIWAATLDASYIEYPEPDPSGYFDKLAPPSLMQGLTYSWAVVNNYSGNPGMVSTAFAGMRSFTVDASLAASCPAPVLTSPLGVTLTGVPVILDWEASAGANNYSVFLMKKEEGDKDIIGSAAVPVWSAYTNDTQVQVPENIAMNSAQYEWYAAAIDSSGKAAKSEPGIFFMDVTYTAQAGLHIIESVLGSQVDVPGAVVYIETVSGGGVNQYPFISDRDGKLYYFLPYGDYKITVKKESFNTKVHYMTIDDMTVPEPEEIIELVRSDYSITGFVKENQTSGPLSGVRVTASVTGSSAETFTGADGSFVVYTDSPGDWQLSFEKAGYAGLTMTASVPDGSISGEYEYALPSDIVMVRNTNYLSGSVQNSSAQPVFGAVVRPKKTAIRPFILRTARILREITAWPCLTALILYLCQNRALFPLRKLLFP